MAQGKLAIGSWNICGLNDAKKRALLLQMVIPMRLDVLCIQETHIPWGKRDLLKLPGYDFNDSRGSDIIETREWGMY